MNCITEIDRTQKAANRIWTWDTALKPLNRVVMSLCYQHWEEWMSYVRVMQAAFQGRGGEMPDLNEEWLEANKEALNKCRNCIDRNDYG